MKNIFGSTTAVRVTRALFLVVFALFLVSTNNTASRADNKDTPDDVMRAGRNANAGLSSMLVALREAQAISARLASDRPFATRVLEAAKRDDKQALAAILKTEAPRSQIQVKSISDFKFEAIIMTDGKQYYVCIGDGCKHRSGKTSPVVFEED